MGPAPLPGEVPGTAAPPLGPEGDPKLELGAGVSPKPELGRAGVSPKPELGRDGASPKPELGRLGGASPKPLPGWLGAGVPNEEELPLLPAPPLPLPLPDPLGVLSCPRALWFQTLPATRSTIHCRGKIMK